MIKLIDDNIKHFENLQSIGLKTFNEKFWKSELRLLKALKQECVNDQIKLDHLASILNCSVEDLGYAVKNLKSSLDILQLGHDETWIHYERLKAKIENITRLMNKVIDNPKENPCNAWFIAQLEQILKEK